MLLTVSCRRNSDPCSCRDGATGDAAAERLRPVRERLEAAGSGLAELELLRQRQEDLVRAVLELQDQDREERLLEENILLLRKQLHCLRRRDVGLVSQLQELDRQMGDLRLDPDASPDPGDADSRPSSGFYDLSDGASASLSNSSNSVFSECFCSLADADGQLLSTEELASCLEFDGLVGGLFVDPSSSGTVRSSLSAPRRQTLDPLPCSDFQSKYCCDLVSRNGADVYRYPSPLHAMAVQSSVCVQMLGHGGHALEEGLSISGSAAGEGLKPDRLTLPLPVPQNSSSSFKRLDGYIHRLLQRRPRPIRTGRPRTSINTDPSKSILRQASLCLKPSPGLCPLRGSETSWTTGGGASWSLDGKVEEQEIHNGFSCGSSDTFQNGVQTNGSDWPATDRGSAPHHSSQPNANVVKKKRGLLRLSAASALMLPKDAGEMGSLKANPSLKEAKQLCKHVDQEPHQTLRTQSTPTNTGSEPESVSLSYSAHKQDDGGRGLSHMVSTDSAPSRHQKLCKHGRMKVNIIKVNQSDPRLERRAHRWSAKKYCVVTDRGSAHLKRSRRVSVEGGVSKRVPAASAGQAPDRRTGAQSVVPEQRHHGNHHGPHHHHRPDPAVVVAKPKYKQKDYARLRHRKKPLSQVSGPYTCVAGSDSEYSAECASLFHSTIVDTSEDEKSNYTTNCFGDSEDEFEDESVTTDDSEENGGGGARTDEMVQGRSQMGAAGGRGAEQETTAAQTKAFVKIRASRNLKKKILRFRSGSLKLMTTV
ncbi:dapper homolog 1 [Genypterus blacodes]|uniref:dapper homolog 1 n=1 Tax=Genypterus blacodes TaxID=154954 RepID=UPI003F766ACE